MDRGKLATMARAAALPSLNAEIAGPRPLYLLSLTSGVWKQEEQEVQEVQDCSNRLSVLIQ